MASMREMDKYISSKEGGRYNMTIAQVSECRRWALDYLRRIPTDERERLIMRPKK